MTDQPDPARNQRGCLIVFGLLIGALLLVYLVGRIDRPRTRTAAEIAPRTSSSSNSSTAFKEVRNDCGACGKASIVGGWESDKGRSIIFTATDSFMASFEDGTSMAGTYEKTPGQVCLLPDIGGRSCFTYAQKTDAMKLGDAIYIRR